MSGIAYQVIWERVLQRFVGSAITSVCLITAIFMAGFCIGALLAGSQYIHCPRRSSSKQELEPVDFIGRLLRIYFVNLIVLAALGFIYVLGQKAIFACFDNIHTSSADSMTLIVALRLLLVSFFLLAPASLMGMSLPLLSQYLGTLSQRDNDSARLYQVNLCGSALGAIITSFFLLPRLGITCSIATSSGLYLFGAILLLPSFISKSSVAKISMGTAAPFSPSLTSERIYDSQRQPLIGPSEKRRAKSSLDDGLNMSLVATIVLFSSSLSFFLQMVFTRLLLLVFGSCSYVYGLVLSIQIVAIAFGSFLSVRFFASMSKHLSVIAVLIAVCLSAALSLYVLLFWLGDLPWLIYSGQKLLTEKFALNCHLAFMLNRILIAFAVMGLPLTLLGTVFPIALTKSQRNFYYGERASNQNSTRLLVSKLSIANTIGAITGSLFGGICLAPMLAQISTSGIQLSIVISIISLIAFAGFLAIDGKKQRLIPVTAYSIIIIISLLFCTPHWDSLMLSSGMTFLSLPNTNLSKQAFRRLLCGEARGNPVELLYYREGSSSTVTVSQIKQSNIIFLKTDGKMEAALPINNSLPAPTSDKLTHVLLGSLPLLLSAPKPENVLLIGYGSGVTCGSILNSQDLLQLSVAEAEPSILPASTFFRNSISNYEELSKAIRGLHSRASMSSFDGRNLLSMLDRNYQVIIAQAGEPWLEGVADLYTLEFWQLAQRRLSPDGLFCQWIPLYGIRVPTFVKMCLTFQTVFPNTLLFHAKNAGEILLVGCRTKANEKMPPIDVAQIEKRLATWSTGKELKQQGINSAADLLSMIIFSSERLQTFLSDKTLPKSSDLSVDDLLNFNWLNELPEGGLTISSDLYKLLKPAPSSTAGLYCNYGTTAEEQESFVAELRSAYARNAEN